MRWTVISFFEHMTSFLVSTSHIFAYTVRFVGKAWVGGDPAAGTPGISHSTAAKTCFEVAAVYAVFLGLSFACMCGNAAKAKLAGR